MISRYLMIQREFQLEVWTLIIQRSSVPPPSLPSLMVFIIITRAPAHCLMSYPAIVATPTTSHLAITTCQYTCDRIKCCMCVFLYRYMHPFLFQFSKLFLKNCEFNFSKIEKIKITLFSKILEHCPVRTLSVKSRQKESF